MSVSLQGAAAPRPPYIQFETRALEDRNATLAKGRRIDREVDFVIVRQAGSKDTSEREALVWLETLDKDPNMMPEWADAFKNAYRRWKDGHEPTPNGTHVSQWPAINKAQASLLIAANLLTVEDLAAANESSLARVGIGARELQNKAKEFLAVANDIGRAAEEMAALRARADGNDEVIKRQRSELDRLAGLVQALTEKIGGQKVEQALEAADNLGIS